MPQFHQDPEQLAAQTGWLRGLARTLVRDESAAEDAVQDTLLLGLRGGPLPGQPLSVLKAWLATTLRRRVSHARRQGISRKRRETARARQPPLGPGSDVVVERAEASRGLLDALMSLPEVSRSMLLLRYFEGQAPAEIAAASGVTSEAIRSRLSRARRELREELDRRSGGDRSEWLAALTPLAGLSGPTRVAVATGPIVATTAITMSIKTKSALVAAVAVAALLTYQLTRPPITLEHHAEVALAEQAAELDEPPPAAEAAAIPEHDLGTERLALRAPAAAESTEKLGPWIRVESTMELPIEELQWSGAEGGWSETSDRRIPRTAERVRAAGHSACVVDRDAELFRIEPDALLVLKFDGITDDAREFDHESSYGPVAQGRIGASLWFARGPDELVAAIDTQRWGKWGKNENMARFSVSLKVGIKLWLKWTPEMGDRIIHELEIPPQYIDLSTAPLSLRPETGDGVQHTFVAKARLAERSVAANILVAPTVGVQIQSRFATWSTEASGPVVTLGQVPVGETVTASIMRGDGSYGIVHFTHTGPVVDVPLTAPVYVEGRLVNSAGEPATGGRAFVTFERDEHSNVIAWQSKLPVPDANGAFRYRFPINLPLLSLDPTTERILPSPMTLLFDLPEHERYTRTFPVLSGGTVDLGDIVLDDRKPDLVVSNGDVIPSSTYYEIAFVDAEGDDESPILERTERDSSGVFRGFAERDSFPHNAAPEQAFLYVGGETVSLIPLTRQGDAQLYLAEEVTLREFTVSLAELDPAITSVSLGVRSGSANVRFCQLGRKATDPEIQSVAVRLPKSNATLYWSERRGYGPWKNHDIGPVTQAANSLLLE